MNKKKKKKRKLIFVPAGLNIDRGYSAGDVDVMDGRGDGGRNKFGLLNVYSPYYA